MYTVQCTVPVHIITERWQALTFLVSRGVWRGRWSGCGGRHPAPPSPGRRGSSHTGSQSREGQKSQTNKQCCGSNTWNLDPDPGFWPKLDPDPARSGSRVIL